MEVLDGFLKIIIIGIASLFGIVLTLLILIVGIVGTAAFLQAVWKERGLIAYFLLFIGICLIITGAVYGSGAWITAGIISGGVCLLVAGIATVTTMDVN